MSAEPWAAIFDTSPGRVTLRFSSPLRAIGLTPQGARRLAAKLLLLAETADIPAPEPAPCPIVDLHQEPAS